MKQRLVTAVQWLPAALAAYVVVVAIEYRHLVRAVFWHSDAAAPFVLVETLRGSGDVDVGHIGAWTSLWGLLLTRSLPFHEQLWEATGLAFAACGVVVLGVVTGRVAGRAGLAAAAGAVAVGPDALSWR